MEYSSKIRRNVKAILNLTPNGKNLNAYLRKYQAIVNCSTLIWMDSWPEEGFREIGRVILEPHADPSHKSLESGEEARISQKDEIVKQALKMHLDIQRGIKKYSQEEGHELHLTPNSFTSLIKTFKYLFKLRVAHYDSLKIKYSAGLDQLRDIEALVFDIQERMQLKSPALVEKQREIEDVLRELDSTTGEME
jgi:dynein heavy chain